MIPFTMTDFVRESNRIEGIEREPTDIEIRAHAELILAPEVTLRTLQGFVKRVAPHAVLRDKVGLDVRVGNHLPPRGGPEVKEQLEHLLDTSIGDMGKGDPYLFHTMYETLHPFTDGNGRSGRALWLRHMAGIERVPLGFLHTWYYQSLSARR